MTEESWFICNFALINLDGLEDSYWSCKFGWRRFLWKVDESRRTQLHWGRHCIHSEQNTILMRRGQNYLLPWVQLRNDVHDCHGVTKEIEKSRCLLNYITNDLFPYVFYLWLTTCFSNKRCCHVKQITKTMFGKLASFNDKLEGFSPIILRCGIRIGDGKRDDHIFLASTQHLKFSFHFRW